MSLRSFLIGLSILAVSMTAVVVAQQQPGYQESASVMSPARNAAAITPDDDADLDVQCRAIYIGGAGNMKVDMLDTGTAVSFLGVVAGTTLAIRVDRVYATDTTAANLVCLY